MKQWIHDLLAKGYSWDDIILILGALPAALTKFKNDFDAALAHVEELLHLFQKQPPAA